LWFYYFMSEQEPQGGFKPTSPVYVTYPIPAELEELEIGNPPDPERLFYQGDRVVEQIVRAAIDKPLDAPSSPRMENRIPMTTRHNVLIKRSSMERKIKHDSEISREISDVLEFADLGKEEGLFDRIRIRSRSTEYRGGKYAEREILPDFWLIHFYKPGESQPAAEISRTDLSFSYIEVAEGETSMRYYPHPDSRSDRDRRLDDLREDHPEMTGQIEAAIKEAQVSILEPMQRAVSSSEVVMTRRPGRSFPDPHTRHIGRIARLSDQLIERRLR
jgi:hypothetical protein